MIAAKRIFLWVIAMLAMVNFFAQSPTDSVRQKQVVRWQESLNRAGDALETEAAKALGISLAVIEEQKVKGYTDRLSRSVEAEANLLTSDAYLRLGDPKRALRYARSAFSLAQLGKNDAVMLHADQRIKSLGATEGASETIAGMATSWAYQLDSWVKANDVENRIESKSKEVALLTQLMIARELERKQPESAKDMYRELLGKFEAIGDSAHEKEVRSRMEFLNTQTTYPTLPVVPGQDFALPEMPAQIAGSYEFQRRGDQFVPILPVQPPASGKHKYISPAPPPQLASPDWAQQVAKTGDELLKKAESLEKKGDYRASLETLKEYQSLQDAYISLAQRQAIDSTENQLQIQAKVQEINYLKEIQHLSKRENSRQRLTFFLALGLTLGLSALLARLFLNKRRSHRELSNAFDQLDQAHKQLQSAQAQLVSAEKMASLGQLTAGIAHEINNPVNFISGNVAPLRKDLEDLLEILDRYESIVKEQGLELDFLPVTAMRKEIEMDYLREEMVALLHGIEEGAGRTTEIVKGLRNFARLDEDSLKMFDLHSGIDSTLILLRNKSDNIQIQRTYGELPEIEGLPGKLNQVFMNLLVNAIHAIRTKELTTGIPGGIMTIDTRKGVNPEMIEIRISDSGSGIPEAIRTKIFDPFFTTKEVGEGTGLGLSISLGIIRQHEGAISVEKSSASGTTMLITLPVAFHGEVVSVA